MEARDSTEEQMWLARQRLGHPPYTVLHGLFPKLRGGLNIDKFVCKTCQSAKFKRTTYPPNTIQSYSPFGYTQ